MLFCNSFSLAWLGWEFDYLLGYLHYSTVLCIFYSCTVRVKSSVLPHLLQRGFGYRKCPEYVWVN